MASELPNVSYDAERALSLPIGLVSPLWLTFGAAAATGAAWWWMTAWTRMSSLPAALEPTNLEAVLAPPLEAAEPVLDAAEAVVEEAAEPLTAAFEAKEVSLEALEQGDLAVETAAPPPIAADMAELADDLTRLVGVGPKLAEALAARGVRTFADIAAWTEEELAAVDRDLDLKGRAVRDAWIAQAKRFAEAAVH